MYGHETWLVGSINDAEYFEGNFKVSRSLPRSNEVKPGKRWCMDMKLGGWGQLMMPKILKVTLRSAGVIQSQMRSNWGKLGKIKGNWGELREIGGN